MESNSTCQKRVCAICNKEINCPEECFVVEDGTKSSNSYNKQFVFICRDCYEKSKTFTFTQEQLDQHDAEVCKPLEERIKMLKLANESFTNIVTVVEEITGKKDVCVDDILNLKNKERQKVLDELLEWVERQPTKVTYDYNTFDGRKIPDTEYIESFPLNQKLSEMKGE